MSPSRSVAWSAGNPRLRRRDGDQERPGLAQNSRERVAGRDARDAEKARDYARRHGVRTGTTRPASCSPNPRSMRSTWPVPLRQPSKLGRGGLVCPVRKPCYVEKRWALLTRRPGTDRLPLPGSLPLFPLLSPGLRKFRKSASFWPRRLGRVESVHYRLASGQHLTCDNWAPIRAFPVAPFCRLGNHVLDCSCILVRALAVESCAAGNRSGRDTSRLRSGPPDGTGQPRIEIRFRFHPCGRPRNSCGSWEKGGPGLSPVFPT